MKLTSILTICLFLALMEAVLSKPTEDGISGDLSPYNQYDQFIHDCSRAEFVDSPTITSTTRKDAKVRFFSLRREYRHCASNFYAVVVRVNNVTKPDSFITKTNLALMTYEKASQYGIPYIARRLDQLKERQDAEVDVGTGAEHHGYLDGAFHPNVRYRFAVAAELDNELLFSISEAVFMVQEGDGSLFEVVLIVLLAILLLITCALLAVLLYMNQTGDSRLHSSFIFRSRLTQPNALLRDISAFRDSQMSIVSFHEGSIEPKSHPIAVDELADYVAKLSKDGVTVAPETEDASSSDNDTLSQEFNGVPRGQIFKWDSAKLPSHRAKNRYGNLLPYDHSRVVLSTTSSNHLGDAISSNNSDYINANFIDGFRSRNRYIATQGPLVTTFDDFWRMVWETNSHQIVMLTNLEENGKNKCDKYWPDAMEKYGKILVTLRKTETYADYTIRFFNVEQVGTNREVVQYHFTAWPDHAVPQDAKSLLTFLSLIRSSPHYQANNNNRSSVCLNKNCEHKSPNSKAKSKDVENNNCEDCADVSSQPMIVHCSAGVGRTGTFILIDTLFDQGRLEKKVDVLAQLCIVRRQRVNLIEKLPQYQFVHQALVEAFETSSPLLEGADDNANSIRI